MPLARAGALGDPFQQLPEPSAKLILPRHSPAPPSTRVCTKMSAKACVKACTKACAAFPTQLLRHSKTVRLQGFFPPTAADHCGKRVTQKLKPRPARGQLLNSYLDLREPLAKVATLPPAWQDVVCGFSYMMPVQKRGGISGELPPAPLVPAGSGSAPPG